MQRNMWRLWGALWLALILACWGSPYPQHMYLQHIPTVAVLLAWPFIAVRYPLSTSAVVCLAAFLLLHMLGARYVYSNVPYVQWLATALGTDLATAIASERNHYDRIVHFAFGLLWVRPVWEVCTRHLGFDVRAALYVAVEFVFAVSMLYEVFEWLLTALLASEAAETYNGQQGDAWDAQKDMALAGIGALIAAVAVGARANSSLEDSADRR